MWNKIKASLYKDTKELFRNMMLLTSVLLPLLLGGMFYFTNMSIEEAADEAHIYERMVLVQYYIVYAITLMSVLTFNITTSVAEENEKKYYEQFIHTEKDYQATLWSKVILYSLVSILIAILVMMIFNPTITFGIYDYIGMACIFIVFALLGLAIGLISKSVSQTSAFMLPFMVLIVMTPMGEVIFGVYNETFLSVAWINILYLNMMIYEGDVWQGMVGNVVYIIVSFVVLVICYRNKRLKIG